MDARTLKELDYYTVREEVARLCASEEGKSLILKREPQADADEIRARKQRSREWTAYLNSGKDSALDSWPPVRGIFHALGADGASLLLEQISAAGQFCRAASRLKDALLSSEGELECVELASQARAIPDISAAESAIFKIITPDGELRDLPELRAIRERISSLQSKIRNILHSFTANPRYADILESTVPVLRAGRQVLAVKSGRRQGIPGIVHELSQTGMTAFIEPEESVRCGNELVQAEFDYFQEVRKILAALSAELRPHSPALSAALEIMEELDATMAAAKWGLERNAVFAAECTEEEEPPALVKARHPLFGGRAVPIDVAFSRGKRVLIITGPNTGGKTATLKTIALLSMLNQSGFPIPAAEGTRLPIFTDIFADIGDSQSLEQSLSTFSGHMKNIAAAVRGAGSKSLILLDELGSGTDPQEGSAIAMAVIDYLIAQKSFVLITTHHGALKNYGYTRPECINASVEFNQDTLRPTYRLLMGVPGESHALDIAEGSGLPDGIITAARGYIATEQADISALIKGLSQKHRELDGQISAVEKRSRDLDEKIRRTDEKALSLRQSEHALERGVHSKAQQFLEDSRRELENLVRILKEGEVTREKTVGVKQFIARLEEETDALGGRLESEAGEIAADSERIRKMPEEKPCGLRKSKKRRPKNSCALAAATPLRADGRVGGSRGDKMQFRVGGAVRAGSFRREGIIVAQAGIEKWDVQFGSIRITMRQSDLIPASQEDVRPSPQVTFDLEPQDGRKEKKPAFELRLLGMRADDALRALERQLDLCILHSFLQFSVIHGKGEGILQQAVHDYLSNSPAVESFNFAPPEDGGTGKTYVRLRSS